MRKLAPSSRWGTLLGTLGFGGRKRSPKPRALQPNRRRTLAVEPLEQRSLLSVCLWDGGGSNANWNNADNWVLESQPSQHVAPQPGDSLRFQGTGATTYNDFPAGTSFAAITFAADDFELIGNDLRLTGDVVANADATDAAISLNVTLCDALTFEVDAAATLSISGNLSGTNYLDKTGPGTLALSGVNTYNGGTTIYDGTLRAESDTALVNTSNGGLLLAGQNAVLDLNGHNASVGAVGLINGHIRNNNATAATLTATRYVVLNGTIEVPLGDNAAPLIKGTAGAVTITGDCDYTGPTTVCGGELKFVGPDAWDPILNGGGADVREGKLVFDYTGNLNANPASTVLSILDAGYGDGSNPFATGQIHCSTIDLYSTTLAWSDDTAATPDQVTIARTTCGDVTLDGTVNFDDFGIVLGNYGMTGAHWTDGDMNYDGVVNFYDYGVVLGDYGQELTALPPAALAVARLGGETTSATSVQFTVVFNKSVTGVDPTDFVLTASGTIASVDDVSPSHAIYLVTVDNVSGDGTLGLNLIDDNTIIDSTSAPLVGNGTDDGSFTGDVYTVDSPFLWDGGGSDAYWTTPENWSSDVAPQPGDRLRFAGAAQTTAESDFAAGNSFASIEFVSSGFTLTGNSFTVTEGIRMATGATTATISADVGLDGSATIDGHVTVDVAAADATLTISGDVFGDGGLTTTGAGVLALNGNLTYTGGTTAPPGSILLPSVFAAQLDAGVEFSTLRPNALLAATPSNLGGSFSAQVEGLSGGTLYVTPDGVLNWGPTLACEPGAYTATVTYTYPGGAQTKEFSVAVADEDMPPTFPFDIHYDDDSPHWHGHDEVFENYPFLYISDIPGVYDWSLQLQQAYDREGSVTYDLVVLPFDRLPDNAAIDANGVFTCTFTSPRDAYQVYQFEVKATDSSGKVDMRHVVLGVHVWYQGQYDTVVADNTYATVPKDSTIPTPIAVTHAGTIEELTRSNGQLHIDVQPSHGTLTSDNSGCVLYTPDPGYRGLDEFWYHWTYDTFDYFEDENGQHPKTGEASTNVSREQIQVGNWMDLVPETTYEPGKSLLAVGGSETTTLTLQNPRGDDISSFGYWTLSFNRELIRVYADGKEILPSGSTFLEMVADEMDVTLTVVGAGAGEATLFAYWRTWAGDNGQPGNNSPWHWRTTQAVNFTVVGVDIYRRNTDDNITNLTSTVIVGQQIALMGVVTPGNLGISSKQWTVPGNESNRIKDYTQTVDQGVVTNLVAADFQSENMDFYWIDGGTDLVVTYTVNIAGLGPVSAHTTFNVLRPEVPLMKSDLTTLDPAVDLRTTGNDPRISFGDYLGSNGIEWTADVTAPAKGTGEIAFVQLVKVDRHRTLRQDDVKEKLQSNGYVLDSAGGVFIQYWYAIRDDRTLDRTDSPKISVNETIKSVSVDDRFRLFLMYRPAGGIWVTLRELDWFWGCSVRNNGANPVWASENLVWTKRSSPPSPPTPFDTTELPTWNDHEPRPGDWVNENNG